MQQGETLRTGSSSQFTRNATLDLLELLKLSNTEQTLFCVAELQTLALQLLALRTPTIGNEMT